MAQPVEAAQVRGFRVVWCRRGLRRRAEVGGAPDGCSGWRRLGGGCEGSPAPARCRGGGDEGASRASEADRVDAEVGGWVSVPRGARRAQGGSLQEDFVSGAHQGRPGGAYVRKAGCFGDAGDVSRPVKTWRAGGVTAKGAHNGGIEAAPECLKMKARGRPKWRGAQSGCGGEVPRWVSRPGGAEPEGGGGPQVLRGSRRRRPAVAPWCDP